jgi:pyruvate dehydrogenase E2 component (dihydrolipoamide acetyltransferase)
MADEFKLPDIGEGLAEGEIVKWLVAEGDSVTEDQPLVEVMTDKATVEIPSPRAGTVQRLVAAEGDIVKIGATIMVFGDGAGNGAGEAAEAAHADEATDRAAVSADQIAEAREVARAERRAVEEPAGERKPWEAPPVPGGAVAPAARRLAAELGVDVAQVAGRGRGGLVTKDDVRAFAGGQAPARRPADAPAAPRAEAPPERKSEPAEPPAAAKPAGVGPSAEERIPLRGLRRTIAERMVIAKTTVPHYTYVEEVDMSEIVALRNQAKPKAAGRGIKLTFLPFIIRALVATLKDHPYLNASLDGEAGEIVLKRYYNIGVAAATDRGLMVPVVHGADARDLFDLAAEIERLSEAARAGSIGLDDLHGGTFTITSTGNIGGFLATPIINVPEVAILGVTAIRERPVVREGRIVVRQMTNLSLSCDHRVVDGAVAALFVRDLVKLLEDPKLQLLAGL